MLAVFACASELSIKTTISQKWAELMTKNQQECEEARQLQSNTVEPKKPIRDTLNIRIGELNESIQWFLFSNEFFF